MGKYNKTTVKIDGKEVEVSKRVIVPLEKQEGDNRYFQTIDGTRYVRLKNGTIKRVGN